MVFTIGIILAGCGTIPALVGEPPAPTQAPRGDSGPLAEDRHETGLAIAEAALALASRQPRGTVIRVNGRRFPLDCSGSILAIHHMAGVDLVPRFSEETGNGVARLWQLGEHSRGGSTAGGGDTRSDRDSPRPGDVIFWDNTYDRNQNGLWDDELTHAGIVTAVDRDGTISYVHHNYRRGIVVEQMNLRHRHDSSRNSPMRMRGQPDPEGKNRWLSSHLYRGARPLY